MSDVTTPIFGLAGFVAGMLLWVQFTRWVGLLYVSGSKAGGDFLGPPKRRLIWAIPFVALLHPAPWLIGVTGIFASRAVHSDAEGSAVWFVAGLSLAVLFMILTTVAAIARWRRLQSSRAGGPNKSLERTREE